MNASPSSPKQVLRPLDEALTELLEHALPLEGVETVSTFDADGRVLAQDLVSALQVPPQDNSSMDGFAVRSGELTSAGVMLPVSQRIPAGSAAQSLRVGSVARIFTGAPIPEGADAVVMQEDTELSGAQGRNAAGEQGTEPGREQSVRIMCVPALGQWIRRSGEDVLRGSVVLAKGERLAPASCGLAASIGMDRLQVARRARVALFSTGDELVLPGEVRPEQMKPGAIYNSNRFFMGNLLRRLGCEVTDYGIVPDRRDATIEALQKAAHAHDLILTSGGVSVGEEDHIRPAVAQLGRLDFWQIAMKPGKPFAYGKVGAAHFIGLPGNPVSSFVTFLLLVRPFLLKLQGANRLARHPVAMAAHFDWPRPDRRREFLRVRRNAEGGLDLFPNQSSGVLTSVVWGDGLVDNPSGHGIARGDTVQFISMAELLA